MDENGLPEPALRGVRGKLQARAQEMFAESISLAPPTDGHGNGHGNGHGDGHAAIGDGEPATVGSGTQPAEVEDTRTGEDGE